MMRVMGASSPVPPDTSGVMVRHNSSTNRAAMNCPSTLGPPSQATRSNPRLRNSSITWAGSQSESPTSTNSATSANGARRSVSVARGRKIRGFSAASVNMGDEASNSARRVTIARRGTGACPAAVRRAASSGRARGGP